MLAPSRGSSDASGPGPIRPDSACAWLTVPHAGTKLASRKIIAASTRPAARNRLPRPVRPCNRRVQALPPRQAEVKMADSVSSRYAALVAAGEIERDPAQEAAVAKLARLNERLAQHRLARKSS